MVIFDAVVQYLDVLTKEKLGLNILIPYAIIMLIIYSLRLLLYYNVKKRQNELKNFSFVAGHILMQFIVSFVSGWFIILATYNDTKSLFIAFVIAPFIGFVAGIYVDNKVLLPLNTLYSKKKPSSSENTSSTSGEASNITINVGSNSVDVDDEKHHKNIEKSKTINNSIIGTEQFETVLVNTINSIIENQNKQYNELESYYSELKETTNALNSIRMSEMLEKKVQLKCMIYDCLNNGFATPAKNDKITQYYLAYVELGGNHEIQALYEQHYLKLGVHEDRRKYNDKYEEYDGIDRRNNTNNYSYGEFDIKYDTSDDMKK